MTNPEILRRDSEGHIISKRNKEYHISFKGDIDIIDIQSYKTLNILTTDANTEDLFFGGAENNGDNKEDEAPKEKSSFENTKRVRIRRYANRNPNALKNIKCSIF